MPKGKNKKLGKSQGEEEGTSAKVASATKANPQVEASKGKTALSKPKSKLDAIPLKKWQEGETNWTDEMKECHQFIKQVKVSHPSSTSFSAQ
jgi:hypothetical protein